MLELRAQGGAAGAMASHASRFNVAWWCRELRTLLRAGMTAVEAIETLAARPARRGPRQGPRGAAAGACAKASRCRARCRASARFRPVLVASVTASERTSTLVDALDDYLRYDEMLRAPAPAGGERGDLPGGGGGPGRG